MSDEIQDSERPRKKKLPPRAADEEAPRRKKAPPRDEDEEDDDRPRQRRRPRQDEDNDLGNNPLGALIPLGTNIWALMAFWLAVLSCVVPGLWLLSLLCAVLSFVTQKFTLSYGSITGNMRAVLGIFISLFAIVLHAVIFFLWYTNKLR